LKNSWHC